MFRVIIYHQEELKMKLASLITIREIKHYQGENKNLDVSA